MIMVIKMEKILRLTVAFYYKVIEKIIKLNMKNFSYLKKNFSFHYSFKVNVQKTKLIRVPPLSKYTVINHSTLCEKKKV